MFERRPPILNERYPDLPSAFGELADRVKRAVLDGDDAPVLAWVAREMHAATSKDLSRLLNAVFSDYLKSAALHGRSAILRRLDRLHTTVDAALRDGDARRLSVEGILVDGMLATVGGIDPSLTARSNAVGALALRIALAMGHESAFVRRCSIAGRLHDIGKVCTPRTILEKPTTLDVQERAAIEEHARQGEEIVASNALLATFAPIVRAHHERLDGSGYPDHLVGMAIPLEARIVAVADVFHAMVSERPYAPTYEASEALAHLEQQRGRLFEAAAVDGLRACLGARNCVAA